MHAIPVLGMMSKDNPETRGQKRSFEETFQDDETTQDKIVKTDTSHKCPHCPSKLATVKSLNRHILNQHGADSVVVECKYPGCGFKTKKANMPDHERTMHGPKINYFKINDSNVIP